MTGHLVRQTQGGTTIKLHRGERKCLIGLDLDRSNATDDFVGFALEFREPGNGSWKRVWNRLRFSYDGLTEDEIRAGAPSTVAPIQKFRWVHFPFEPRDGEYRYRATPMYMRADGSLVRGQAVEAAIDLSHETIRDILDVGFTRGYASSQAYADAERFPCQARILPPPGSAPPADLDHDMSTCQREYAWLGFEGRATIYQLLDEALADPSVTVDAMLYELREPMIVGKLEALGSRLRAIVDNHDAQGDPTSNESIACDRFTAAGAAVKRGKFGRQQHNKVVVLRRNGTPYKALAGSTNFTLRGLYVQSNNTIVFRDTKATALFGAVFERYFAIIDKRGAAGAFHRDPLSQVWHDCTPAGGPVIRIAISPHEDPALALDPVVDAVEQAESSVLYAVVFLNQLSGRVRDTLEELVKHRSTFSYGIAQRTGGLSVFKPDGSRGLVSFAYLAEDAPEPFAAEWSSHAGGNSRSNVLHHKFVVTDFNTPRARVFTGSSNMAKGGERDNGDHLIMIEDGRVATAYAVEALRTFDHFHFRVAMNEADRKRQVLKLATPPAPGGPTWFREVYVPGHIKARDRLLFSA
ncbi:phospholipase D-like domain-containing protein [Ancylobacter sp. VNQ12]|uniref:phospholipase D-like domain-containing protein n=1 Tax=Ancylobacter sp. VNQ12 TaxID=3400920 RepID=UPI003BFE7ED7